MKKNKSINDSDNYKIAFEKGKIEGKEERDIETVGGLGEVCAVCAVCDVVVIVAGDDADATSE